MAGDLEFGKSGEDSLKQTNPPCPEVVREARPLPWAELLPHAQEALIQLLRVLTTAATSTKYSVSEAEQPSTSILIRGDRGYGKTTVLLTAKHVSETFEQSIGDNSAHNYSAFQPWLLKLKWLDVLDLESVPSQANLLATLLVRIRDALDQESPQSRSRGLGVPSSILEEGIERPWKKLDRLLRDAAFMWEDAFGSNDPRRERAEQQITAAEQLSKFQKEFRTAIELVSKALTRRQAEQGRVLVLPIDHVDRSIDHLYNIVKLLRLASSHHLWFLLAAGRPDLQLFLEQAFQRETLSGDRKLSSPSGPGLDENAIEQARVIARYQAAATLLRTLPPTLPRS